MKITRIVIPAFQQFTGFDLDLTDPATGKPLDRVCFIGRNGTGKSTLLRLISVLLRGHESQVPHYRRSQPNAPCLVGIAYDGKTYWLIGSPAEFDTTFSGTIEESVLFATVAAGKTPWRRRGPPKAEEEFKSFQKLMAHSLRSNEIQLMRGDLVVYSPPDTGSLLPSGQSLPTASVNEALPLLKYFPIFHEVSAEQVNSFWNVLIYHIKKARTGLARVSCTTGKPQ